MKLMTSLFNNLVPSEVLEIWGHKDLEGDLNKKILKTHAPWDPDLSGEQLVHPGMDMACIPSIFIKNSHFFLMKAV